MLVLAYENVQLFFKTFRNGGVSLANIAYIRVSAQDQNTGRQYQCFDNAVFGFPISFSFSLSQI